MSGSYGWAVPNYDYLPTQYFLNAAPDWPKSAYSVFGDKAMTHSGPRPLYPGRRAMVLFPDRPSLLLPGTYDPASGYGMRRRGRGYGMRRRGRGYGATDGAGSTFTRLTPWLIGAGVMYFGFRGMEKGPPVRDNPAPLLIPVAVGLGLLGAFTGGQFLFGGDALFGLTVGGAVGAGYGAVKDQGMIKYGLAGSALGWAFAKILERMTPED